MNPKLLEAISLIEDENEEDARQLIQEVIKGDPKDEAAWLWLESITVDEEEKRVCLQNVLSLNPKNQIARKRLNELSVSQQQINISPLKFLIIILIIILIAGAVFGGDKLIEYGVRVLQLMFSP